MIEALFKNVDVVAGTRFRNPTLKRSVGQYQRNLQGSLLLNLICSFPFSYLLELLF
jgi:hypothetical protein